MISYTHILAAVDLSEDSSTIVEKATDLAKLSGARLSICHVIEPINFAYGGDIPMDLTVIQDQLYAHAQTKLAELSQTFAIPKDNQMVLIGVPQSEIHRISAEQSIDLVVLGSHGRHGLSLLFGSTPNSVLHGATCDVLAVWVNS